MVLMFACLCHPVALLYVASMWLDCHQGVQNGADLCLSVSLCCPHVHRE